MSRMLTFLIIGVAIGVLIAPEKGTVTRSKIGDLFADLTDDTQDLANDFADRVKDRVDDFKS